MTGHILHLFTDAFPCGKGEAFIQDEIGFLAGKFDKIYIYPIRFSSDQRSLPGNCEVVDISGKSISLYNGKKVFTRNKWLYSGSIIRELIKRRFNISFLSNIREHSSILLQAISRSEILQEHLDRVRNKHIGAVNFFYSHWLYDWAITLGILKLRNVISGYISRAHSFDIYEDYFRPDKTMPFRFLQLDTVSCVYTDSAKGMKYFHHRFPAYTDKVKTSYAGVMESGVNKLVSDGKIKIVSCSFIIPRKRVHLIIEILKNVKSQVEWTHIGDGPLREFIQGQAATLPPNIKVHFPGYMSHEQIAQVYRETPFDLFIHLSDQEGLANVLIEAISYGIPVMATDVGGTAEIVCEKTGILLESDPDVRRIATMLDLFSASNMNTLEFRKGIKSFWKSNFDALTNYERFYRELVTLEMD